MYSLTVMLHVFPTSYKLTKLLNTIRARKKYRSFEPLFVCCTFEAKFLPYFYLRSFTATPILMFELLQSKHVVNKVSVFQECWGSVAGCFCFVSQSRNNTSTSYKAIIQIWRLSMANQSKTNIDKNLCWFFAYAASKAVFQHSSQPYTKCI